MAYETNKYDAHHYITNTKILYPPDHDYYIPRDDSKKCSYTCYPQDNGTTISWSSMSGGVETNTCKTSPYFGKFCEMFNTVPSDYFSKNYFCYEIAMFDRW